MTVGAGLVTAGSLIIAAEEGSEGALGPSVSGVVVAGGGSTTGLSILPDADDARRAAAVASEGGSDSWAFRIAPAKDGLSAWLLCSL